MLEFLALRKGMTISKDMFLSHLYGGMDEPELKIIDVFMCKLRKKLVAVSGGADYIETTWERGYVLREPQRGGLERCSCGSSSRSGRQYVSVRPRPWGRRRPGFQYRWPASRPSRPGPF
jgi:DNA-binding winged helix-turn-helix (wHTH) protein